MTADQALNEIFDKIPERDRTVLLSNGITDLSKLVDKKPQLQNPSPSVIQRIKCFILEEHKTTISYFR